MRASKGALTHDAILRLHWRQFGVYLDAFTFWLREESEDGRQENAEADIRAKRGSPEWKAAKQRLTQETKRDVAKHKAFAASRPAGGEVRDMLKAE